MWDANWILARAKHFLADRTWASRKIDPKHEALTPLPAEKWHKPQKGHFQCNAGSPFFQEMHTVGTRMCVRDHIGASVIAESSCSGAWMEVNEGEAFSLLQAMHRMLKRAEAKVIFEIDCKLFLFLFQLCLYA